MADEIFGVIDGNKTYTHHAIARVLGVQDAKNECSRFVLRNLLKAGLNFVPVGRLYFVNGHNFNLWIQERAAPWEAWKDPNTKSSGDASESDSSAGGTTARKRSGGTKRSISD